MRLIAVAALWFIAAGCDDPRPPDVEVPEPTVAEPSSPKAAAKLPDRPLRFGRPPHLNKEQTKAEYQPMADHLARVIDHEIEMVVPDTYGDVIDLLAKGELDLALLTPFSYVGAKERLPDLHILASLLGEGSPQYRGYIVTAAGSPIDEIAELRGRRFAFVDERSASGYLFPLALLLEHGVDPDRDFKAVQFLGDHPSVVHALEAGSIDGGAISSTTFKHMRSEAVAQKVQIIGKTEWIPLDAFVAHPTVPTSAVEKLRAGLLALSVRTPEGRKVLIHITTTNGFVAGDDAVYDGVRRVAAKVGPARLP